MKHCSKNTCGLSEWKPEVKHDPRQARKVIKCLWSRAGSKVNKLSNMQTLYNHIIMFDSFTLWRNCSLLVCPCSAIACQTWFSNLTPEIANHEKGDRPEATRAEQSLHQGKRKSPRAVREEGLLDRKHFFGKVYVSSRRNSCFYVVQSQWTKLPRNLLLDLCRVLVILLPSRVTNCRIFQHFLGFSDPSV